MSILKPRTETSCTMPSPQGCGAKDNRCRATSSSHFSAISSSGQLASKISENKTHLLVIACGRIEGPPHGQVPHLGPEFLPVHVGQQLLSETVILATNVVPETEACNQTYGRLCFVMCGQRDSKCACVSDEGGDDTGEVLSIVTFPNITFSLMSPVTFSNNTISNFTFSNITFSSKQHAVKSIYITFSSL